MWHFPLWNMLQDPSSSLLLVQLLLWLHSLAVVGLSRKAGVFLEQWVEIVKLSLNFLIVTGIHGSILWTMVGHHVEGIILQFWIMRNNFFFSCIVFCLDVIGLWLGSCRDIIGFCVPRSGIFLYFINLTKDWLNIVSHSTNNSL